ncbi:diacylglycerol/lipid kinase family protein [Anaerotignum sp.]|uniref:diacylglycerol/lipid kinase family protein n=1 Tax=Anaerotignum sp. TaxID=2039241 RepID=UPI0027149249|nr:YegS/Rv2252/BmrU family lipid kinase [Anaerotignum sp.]
MKHYFIINPKAGHGKGRNMIPKIQKALDGRGISYCIHMTRCQGDAEVFIREKAQDGRTARFYVCGGDGTLHEAMNGAYGFTNVSVGLIPTGTGNDFVKNFAPKDAFFNIEAQMNGTEIPIDLIRVNDKLAVNMINIGFDCEVAAEATKLKRYPLVRGSLAYWMGLCKRFCGPMGNEMEISHGDDVIFSGEFLLCTIANGSFCGGAFRSSPYAKIDDGLMDFGGIRKFTRLKLLKMLPSYQNGTYLKKMERDKGVYYKQCENLSMRTRTPLFASVDGEIISFTHLDMKIEKRAAKFIMPKGTIKIEKPTTDKKEFI